MSRRSNQRTRLPSSAAAETGSTHHARGQLRRLARVQLACVIAIALGGGGLAMFLGRALIDARRTEAALDREYASVVSVAYDLGRFESRFWRERDLQGHLIPEGAMADWLRSRVELAELTKSTATGNPAILALARSVATEGDELVAVMMNRGTVVGSAAERAKLAEGVRHIKRIESMLLTWVAELRKAQARTQRAGDRQTRNLVGLTLGVVALMALGALALTVSFERARARLAARLVTLAESDALTALPNRRAFHDKLTEIIERTRTGGSVTSVAVLDVDHFKRLNDEYGHLAGDDALRETASALRGCARSTDLVARFGGEEFAWILPDTTVEQAAAIVDRARAAVAQLRLPSGASVTLSAGISSTRQSHDPERLVDLADAAMYLAKTGGRNCTRLSEAPERGHHESLESPGLTEATTTYSLPGTTR